MPVILKIIIGNIWGSWLLKKISGEDARMERFFLNYVAAAFLATTISFCFGSIVLGTMFFLIVGLGFANGLAAYCQWRAVDISLSKTHLFTWGDDVIALVLAYTLLNESQFITSPIAFGILISFLSVALFLLHDYRRRKVSAEGDGPASLASPMLYVWVLGYSVIWGVATFLMKYFAVEGVPVTEFLQGWYSGAALAALLLLSCKVVKQGKIERLSGWQTISSVAFAATVMADIFFKYWSLTVAPLVVVQPVFLVAEMIAPTLMGLFGFGERKQFDRMEWFYFGLGVLGAQLIILGFLLR